MNLMYVVYVYKINKSEQITQLILARFLLVQRETKR